LFRYLKHGRARIIASPKALPKSYFRSIYGEQDISLNSCKGMIMTSNKQSRPGNQGGTHEQHVKAGQQSHKNSGNSQSASSGANGGARSGGVQGGTPEQHAEAGRQSHKNDGNKQSAGGAASGTRGGTPEQHAAAGRQSRKNAK
jgi:hypothetical protein